MMRIKDISAGTSHAAMVDEMNRVFTWGLGSYGRNAGVPPHIADYSQYIGGFIGTEILRGFHRKFVFIQTTCE